MKSMLGNARRATVLVHGRAELHLGFNNYDELEQAYRELDALEGKPAPSSVQQDAARWRMLPAFLEAHQIDYVKLLADINAALR